MTPTHRDSGSKSTPLTYRPALDGLRAIAVLAVFIFHLEPALLPGGFVGVDIFFVLSGYLITRIIHQHLESDSFSLAQFYQRRIARIAPALFVVCVAVLTTAAFVYMQTDFATAGAAVAATAVSALNIKMIFQDNYFKLSPDALPLLHCWSLSLEEQFYLAYPFLIGMLYRWRRDLLFPVIATLTVVSGAACVVLTPIRPNYAFYLPLTRAWELGCGGLVALGGALFDSWATRARYGIAGAGVAVLAVAVACTPGGNVFPGVWALLPVAGTLLVIVDQHLAIDGVDRDRVTRALASTPLVGVGKMSYSLYLWHWPVFSFIDYVLVFAEPVARGVLKVLVAFACAGVSYALIEKPLRVRLARPEASRFTYGAFLVSMIALFTAGYAVRKHNYLGGTITEVRNGGVRYCDGPGRPVVVLVGDSTACTIGTTVRDLCCETNTTLVMAAVPGMNLLPKPSKLDESFGGVIESIVSCEHPKCVIVSARWTTVLKTPEDRDLLDSFIKTIVASADRVVVLEQPPTLPFEATRQGMREGGRPPFRERPEVAVRRREANDAVRSLVSDRIHVINVDQYFLDGMGAIRRWDSEGNDLFLDSTHLSASGAQLVARELVAVLEAP